MRNARILNEINNEIWVFLERNTKRNLVHFKRSTGQGQAVSFNGLWAKFMHMCPRVLDDSRPVISKIQHSMDLAGSV